MDRRSRRKKRRNAAAAAIDDDAAGVAIVVAAAAAEAVEIATGSDRGTGSGRGPEIGRRGVGLGIEAGAIETGAGTRRINRKKSKLVNKGLQLFFF